LRRTWEQDWYWGGQVLVQETFTWGEREGEWGEGDKKKVQCPEGGGEKFLKKRRVANRRKRIEQKQRE